MFYVLIGALICIISMSAYEWPQKDGDVKDWFSSFAWILFIVLFWPIVLGVWACGALLQYFSKDGG